MPIRALTIVLAVCVSCGLLLSGCAAAPAGRTVGSHDHVRDAAVEPRALAILRRWDRRRSTAWAAGDARALAALYLPGSAAGSADVSLLRRYLRRGVAVPDVRMQVVQCAVLVDRRRRVVVRVVERLVTGSVLVDGTSLALPRDAASVHLVELRRADGRWRVASVVAD